MSLFSIDIEDMKEKIKNIIHQKKVKFINFSLTINEDYDTRGEKRSEEMVLLIDVEILNDRTRFVFEELNGIDFIQYASLDQRLESHRRINMLTLELYVNSSKLRDEIVRDKLSKATDKELAYYRLFDYYIQNKYKDLFEQERGKRK